MHCSSLSLRPWRFLACLAVSMGLGLAQAQTPSPAGRGGKLLLTGGVSSVEGAAGGGLTPWAVTGSYATEGQTGLTAFASRLRTADYGLTVQGAGFSWGETAELSLATQTLDTGPTGTALGLPGLRLKLDILSLKWKLLGDAVLDSDTWRPQVAVGLAYKRTRAGGLAPTLQALGADLNGVDLTLSATKLWLSRGLLFNATLRATQANQGGLLGFKGAAQSSYRWMPEASVAWLLRPDLAVGLEVRLKPDNLNPSPLGAGLKEDDWHDLFLAWAPSKHLSLTAAWVDLGRVVPATAPRRQAGAYLSVQLAY